MNKKTAFTRFEKPNRFGNTLLLTHNDLDGSGPVVLLKTIFPNLTVQHCTNASMSYDIKNAVCNPNLANTYSTIFVTDISCNEDDAIKIDKHPNSKKLILLDHHQTAAHLNQYKWARVCVESLEDSYRNTYYPEGVTAMTSGTSLLYDFLEYFKMFDGIDNINMDHIKNLVHLIASYDTWDWHNVFDKKPEFQTLDKLHDIYGCARIEEKLLKYITSDDELFNGTDKLFLEVHEEQITTYLNSIEKCFRTGNLNMNGTYYSVVFCNSNDYPGETLERMKELYPDYDLYFINYGTGLSFRATKDNINVGAILKELGGGGHAGAGGIKIDFELLLGIIKDTLHADLIVDERK